MKKYVILLIVICLCQPSSAQIMWQYSYGGSDDDFGRSIVQTTDGGYIVAAETSSNDGDVSGIHYRGSYVTDYWVIKLSANGSLQWQKCLGGSSVDDVSSIAQCSDGGYIVAGSSSSTDGDVSGYHGGIDDYWIVKLSATGDIEWQKCLGGSANDNTTSIIQTFDSGFIVVGFTQSTDGDVSGGHGYDAWIVKLSALGSIQWQKCIGVGKYYIGVNAVIQTPDSGYILAGYRDADSVTDTFCNHGSTDFMIVKLSSAGAILWQKGYGGSGGDEAISIAQTIDGGFVVTGVTRSDDGDVLGTTGDQSKRWVIKLSSVGDLLWQQCSGGTTVQVGYSIAGTADGGCIVSGLYNSDGSATGTKNWISKLSSSGNMEWETNVGNYVTVFSPIFPSCIMQSSDGNYVYTGVIQQDGNSSSANVYVVKLGPNVGIPNVLHPSPAISVFPNPTTGSFTLQLPQTNNPTTITITNLLGSTIETRTIENTQPQNINFNLHAPPGAYIIKVTSGPNTWRDKIEIW